MRKENDQLGTMSIPESALYGIHSVRARDNFPNKSLFHKDWYKAIGKVKLACYLTYEKFKKAVDESHPDLASDMPQINDIGIRALQLAATEIFEGKHYEEFIVPAIQGGAGTSINMNINEIICNRALELLDKKPGDYSILDPIESANIYQSTNDVIPTALVIAVMEKLNLLEEKINTSRAITEKLETKYRNSLRLAYTQLQEAVPSTYGMLFSSYSDALSRDWWRVSKSFERIKLVNLGGGAIGTGLAIPRFFLMEVVPNLKKLTGLPVTQAENICDATANQDSLVEVHAILKAHAVNMEKIVSDLRLLASGLNQTPELKLPDKQTGSSIMPGKINPVIPEFIISSAHQIYANDQLVTSLSAQGNLELNAYIPSIGHAILGSLDLLIDMNTSMTENLLSGITINEKQANSRLMRSPAITTALSHLIGYHKAGELAKTMKEESIDIFEANEKIAALDTAVLRKILSPERLLKKGFTMSDIREIKEIKK
ncbi:MAG: hypothetical protein K9H49_16235 [Bacteroidales bacterium]|nr:hypothetical protein [Bacteroidales bacterium]MCF8405873.1 hypothetical protein [Bacteroidales bacterium]